MKTRPTKELLEQIRVYSTEYWPKETAELFAEIDAQAGLIATMARLLKDREFCRREDACLECGADYTRKHKPDCELAAALRSAGIDVAVEAP